MPAPQIPVAPKQRRAGPPGTLLAPMARGFWGCAWIDHLERFCDAGRQLRRGRSLARGEAVALDPLERAVATARVEAEAPFEVRIEIDPMPPARWKRAVDAARGSVTSLASVYAGEADIAALRALKHPRDGIFPQRAQMHLSCDCDASTRLCSHVAATLYTLGRHFDDDPTQLFFLRGIVADALVDDDAYSALADAAAADVPAQQGKRVAETAPKPKIKVVGKAGGPAGAATSSPDAQPGGQTSAVAVQSGKVNAGKADAGKANARGANTGKATAGGAKAGKASAAASSAASATRPTAAPATGAGASDAKTTAKAPRKDAGATAAPVVAQPPVRRRSAASAAPTDEVERFVLAALGERPEEEMQILGIFQASEGRFTFAQLQRALAALEKAGRVLSDEDETGDVWWAIKLG